MDVNEALHRGADRLEIIAEEALDGDPPLTVSAALLADLIGLRTSELRWHLTDEVPPDAECRFYARLVRFSDHEPLQYILGRTWFYGLEFGVGPDVLIPRPDTEILVEAVLEKLGALFTIDGPILGGDAGPCRVLRMWEPCTGTGCISLAVANEFVDRYPGRDLDILATDVSPAALRYANRNLEDCRSCQGVKIGPAEQVRISLGLADLFNPVPEKLNEGSVVDVPTAPGGRLTTEDLTGRFHIVAANPPYIPSDVCDGLPCSVREHEPRMALDGGRDGLDLYRRFCDEAGARLYSNGWLILEHGYDQREVLLSLFSTHPDWSDVEDRTDLAGRDRVLIARRR